MVDGIFFVVVLVWLVVVWVCGVVVWSGAAAVWSDVGCVFARGVVGLVVITRFGVSVVAVLGGVILVVFGVVGGGVVVVGCWVGCVWLPSLLARPGIALACLQLLHDLLAD
jgi:hypothetical protein